MEIQALNCDGDSWYVTFVDDDAALIVLESLRKLQFKGQAIQARIKNETSHKNYLSEPYSTDGANPYYSYQNEVYMVTPPYTTTMQYWDNNRNYRGSGFENPRGRGSGRGRRKDYNSRGPKGRSSDKISGSDRSNGPSTRKKRGSQGIQLVSSDFPPLPSAAFEQSKTRYTNEYIKYSKQEIVNIVSQLEKEKITKPTDLPQLDKVTLDKPNTDIEVLKPYPKRVTAAEIVQMNSTSPKGNEQNPRSNSDKQIQSEKTLEKDKKSSERTKSSKSEKSHNGGSKGSKESKKTKEGKGFKDSKERKEKERKEKKEVKG